MRLGPSENPRQTTFTHGKGRFSLLLPVRSWLLYAAFLSMFVNALLLAAPIYMLQIFDRVLVSHSLQTLGMLTLITFVLVGAYAILEIVRASLLLRAGIEFEQFQGPRAFDCLHQFDTEMARAGGRAELMRDVTTLRNYFSSPHLVSLFDCPWVPFFTLLIFGFSWVLGVITLIGMLVVLLLAYADERLTYSHFSAAQSASQEAAQFGHNSIRNVETVHTLGMSATMAGLWGAHVTSALASLKRASNRSIPISGLTKAARILVQVAMLGAGAYLIIVDSLPPGIMIASTIIVARAIGPLEASISGWRSFVDARNAYARVDGLIRDAEKDVWQRGISLPAIEGRLSMEGASFRFSARTPLLENISVSLQPGEMLGLAGPSGAGKSTIARLMLGLIRPIQGTVSLDGYDIQQYDRSAIGTQLGYLPQNVELFSGTVASNICRMREPSECSAEIVRIGERMGLGSVIARLPNGYDTWISGNGQNLSGGQRQLIGLARALYGSPRIVVLDEPDANLDQEGEALLLNLIDGLRAERRTTLVVVSHNPKIIDRMDRLVVVESGRWKQLERKQDAKAAAGPVSVVG